MLERAVAEIKGEAAPTELRATINLGVDLRIPPAYIPSENLRLRTYKRIAEISAESAARGSAERAGGSLWPAAPSRSESARLCALEGAGGKNGRRRDRTEGAQVSVKFHPQTSVKPERLVSLLRSGGG